MGAGASKTKIEDQRRQQELEEQRRIRRPKVRNIRELRAALRGKEPEIALMQGCRFHLKSEQDVARERAEALQADQDARADHFDSTCGTSWRVSVHNQVAQCDRTMLARVYLADHDMWYGVSCREFAGSE